MLLLRDSAQQARELAQVLARGESRVHPGRLEHGAKMARRLHVLAPAVEAGNAGASRIRPQQPQQHADRGRLAGAVGPEETEDLPHLDAEVDVLHGRPRAKPPGEVLDFEDHRAAASARRASSSRRPSRMRNVRLA